MIFNFCLACNVLYLFTMDTESLTGPQAIKKAVTTMFEQKPLPTATIVHFKVSTQGITLTDNARKLFFRRHYPTNNISYCGLDTEERTWDFASEETGRSVSAQYVLYVHSHHIPISLKFTTSFTLLRRYLKLFPCAFNSKLFRTQIKI